MSKKSPDLYIIAGPNGAGKTTFAKEFLPHYAGCENFVNADLIAQGLSPFSPAAAGTKAGRLVLKQIHEFAERRADFAFETTLKVYRPLLDSWTLFDNSTTRPSLIAEEKDGKLTVVDAELFAEIHTTVED